MLNRVVEASMFKGGNGEHDEEEEEGMDAGSIECFGLFLRRPIRKLSLRRPWDAGARRYRGGGGLLLLVSNLV